MNRLGIAALGMMAVLSTSGVFAAEDFKGEPSPTELTAGVMAGGGIIDSRLGFALTGVVAKKIINQGFAPDIANQVFIEAEFGPVFLSGDTAWAYSAHLRWDFLKDPSWTFFAMGGVGGNVADDPRAVPANSTNRFAVFPRFGVGAFWHIQPMFAVRGEVSHEHTSVGVSFPF